MSIHHIDESMKVKTFEDLKQLVKTEIEKCPIDTELDVLYETLQYESSVIDHHCQIVTDDLRSILLPLGPKQIRLFGSTAMGVSLQGCDLDFHVAVTERTQDTTGLLHRVHGLLAASKKFNDFKIVCKARVPIVKCFHIGTAFKCDINFTCSIGVYNSQIMAHLFRIDPRVQKLAILVKFWMKCHNLIASKSITSYAALWLVIFYLQQLDTPLIPPIEVFQRDVPPFSIRAADLSFNFTLPNLLTKNVDGISTLLHGFFEFYAKFDFGTQFISPLHGREFPRYNFEGLFPHHFARYREVLESIPTAEPMRFGKQICIQDPFEICRSIPGILNGIYYLTFRTALTNGAQICRDNFTTTGGSKELLLALFNSELILLKEPAKYFIVTDHRQRNMKATITAIPKETDTIKEYLQRNCPNAFPCNKDIKQLWVDLCISFLKDMFRDIFGFQILSEKSSDSDFSKSFDMIATKNVFGTRKPMKSPVANIDVEMKRTKKKLKKAAAFGGKPLEINCRTWSDAENSSVFVDITDNGSNPPQIDYFYAQFQKRARQLIYAYFDQEFDVAVASLVKASSNIEFKDLVHHLYIKVDGSV